MHEYGIAQRVLETALKELSVHNLKKITKIRLKVGRFNLLTKESLQAAFDLAAEKTSACGAVLDIEETPGTEMEVKEIEAE